MQYQIQSLVGIKVLSISGKNKWEDRSPRVPSHPVAKAPRDRSERRAADEAAQVLCSLPGEGRSAWWATGGQGTPGEQTPLPSGSSWGS